MAGDQQAVETAVHDAVKELAERLLVEFHIQLHEVEFAWHFSASLESPGETARVVNVRMSTSKRSL